MPNPFKKTTVFLLFAAILLNPVSAAFAATTLLPPNYSSATASFSQVTLQGIRLDPTDPFVFEFLFDAKGTITQKEFSQQVEYFLAALTLPEKELWVNLSPYEPQRICTDQLAQTELGKNMLSQDYSLKQLAAGLTYPETAAGKKYWDEINGAVPAGRQVGARSPRPGRGNPAPTTNFNRIWITTDKAIVYEHANTAVIKEASLKVMMEEDFIAAQQSVIASAAKQSQKIAAVANSLPRNDTNNAFRRHILPLLQNEIDAGNNFAQLRQIYHAFILASWFKKKLKDSIYKYYINQKKIAGIDIEDKNVKEKVYNQYLEAFKKGAYDYIKTEQNNFKRTRRHYFSGGIALSDSIEIEHPPAQVVDILAQPLRSSLVELVSGTGNSFAAQKISSLFTPAEELSEISPETTQIIATAAANDDSTSQIKKYSNKFIARNRPPFDVEIPYLVEPSLPNGSFAIYDHRLLVVSPDCAADENGLLNEIAFFSFRFIKLFNDYKKNDMAILLARASVTSYLGQNNLTAWQNYSLKKLSGKPKEANALLQQALGDKGKGIITSCLSPQVAAFYTQNQKLFIQALEKLVASMPSIKPPMATITPLPADNGDEPVQILPFTSSRTYENRTTNTALAIVPEKDTAETFPVDPLLPTPALAAKPQLKLVTERDLKPNQEAAAVGESSPNKMFLAPNTNWQAVRLVTHYMRSINLGDLTIEQEEIIQRYAQGHNPQMQTELISLFEQAARNLTEGHTLGKRQRTWFHANQAAFCQAIIALTILPTEILRDIPTRLIDETLNTPLFGLDAVVAKGSPVFYTQKLVPTGTQTKQFASSLQSENVNQGGLTLEQEAFINFYEASSRLRPDNYLVEIFLQAGLNTVTKHSLKEEKDRLLFWKNQQAFYTALGKLPILHTRLKEAVENEIAKRKAVIQNLNEVRAATPEENDPVTDQDRAPADEKNIDPEKDISALRPKRTALIPTERDHVNDFVAKYSASVATGDLTPEQAGFIQAYKNKSPHCTQDKLKAIFGKASRNLIPVFDLEAEDLNWFRANQAAFCVAMLELAQSPKALALPKYIMEDIERITIIKRMLQVSLGEEEEITTAEIIADKEPTLKKPQPGSKPLPITTVPTKTLLPPLPLAPISDGAAIFFIRRYFGSIEHGELTQDQTDLIENYTKRPDPALEEKLNNYLTAALNNIKRERIDGTTRDEMVWFRANQQAFCNEINSALKTRGEIKPDPIVEPLAETPAADVADTANDQPASPIVLIPHPFTKPISKNLPVAIYYAGDEIRLLNAYYRTKQVNFSELTPEQIKFVESCRSQPESNSQKREVAIALAFNYALSSADRLFKQTISDENERVWIKANQAAFCQTILGLEFFSGKERILKDKTKLKIIDSTLQAALRLKVKLADKNTPSAPIDTPQATAVGPEPSAPAATPATEETVTPPAPEPTLATMPTSDDITKPAAPQRKRKSPRKTGPETVVEAPSPALAAEATSSELPPTEIDAALIAPANPTIILSFIRKYSPTTSLGLLTHEQTNLLAAYANNPNPDLTARLKALSAQALENTTKNVGGLVLDERKWFQANQQTLYTEIKKALTPKDTLTPAPTPLPMPEATPASLPAPSAEHDFVLPAHLRGTRRAAPATNFEIRSMVDHYYSDSVQLPIGELTEEQSNLLAAWGKTPTQEARTRLQRLYSEIVRFLDRENKCFDNYPDGKNRLIWFKVNQATFCRKLVELKIVDKEYPEQRAKIAAALAQRKDFMPFAKLPAVQLSGSEQSRARTLAEERSIPAQDLPPAPKTEPQIQAMVDAYNKLPLGELTPDQQKLIDIYHENHDSRLASRLIGMFLQAKENISRNLQFLSKDASRLWFTVNQAAFCQTIINLGIEIQISPYARKAISNALQAVPKKTDGGIDLVDEDVATQGNSAADFWVSPKVIESFKNTPAVHYKILFFDNR